MGYVVVGNVSYRLIPAWANEIIALGGRLKIKMCDWQSDLLSAKIAWLKRRFCARVSFAVLRQKSLWGRCQPHMSHYGVINMSRQIWV